MDLTFAHYRNRFCMFCTYYALAVGKVKAEGINMEVVELPDPPNKEQEDALLASVRYPRVEFTFTEKEQRLAQAEMQLLADVGQIPRTAPIASMFAR